MRVDRGRRRAAAALVALLLAGACSSPQGTESPENSLLGKDKDGKGAAAPGKKQDGGGKRPERGRPGEVTPPPGTEIAVPSPGRSAAANSGAAKTETEVTSTGSAVTSASVVVTEPDADAEKTGVPPEYPDILSARVEGSAKSFRVTITFRADLPDAMPDDKTYMVAGFGLTGSKNESGYAFGAQADADGWKPYGGDKEGGGYPGQMSLQGDTIVFITPWSAIGGPRAFQWYAQSTWFKSLAGTTHYSLDNVPNEGPAKYPAG
ncbi:MAG TPA: hypothetical protein VG318_06640 [Actinomycetota bacterium]|nr:hypothetical protein [Actinomycetota bacterium]